jgi:hypothetical protein
MDNFVLGSTALMKTNSSQLEEPFLCPLLGKVKLSVLFSCVLTLFKIPSLKTKNLYRIISIISQKRNKDLGSPKKISPQSLAHAK